MSDHNERACTSCGSLLHHEEKCQPSHPETGVVMLTILPQTEGPYLFQRDGEDDALVRVKFDGDRILGYTRGQVWTIYPELGGTWTRLVTVTETFRQSIRDREARELAAAAEADNLRSERDRFKMALVEILNLEVDGGVEAARKLAADALVPTK